MLDKESRSISVDMQDFLKQIDEHRKEAQEFSSNKMVQDQQLVGRMANDSRVLYITTETLGNINSWLRKNS